MKKNETKQYWKFVAIKFARTFIQSFIGVLVAAGTGVISVDVLTNASVSGLVAGLSALQNALEQYTPKQTYQG
jgi:hypothetical protein